MAVVALVRIRMLTFQSLFATSHSCLMLVHGASTFVRGKKEECTDIFRSGDIGCHESACPCKYGACDVSPLVEDGALLSARAEVRICASGFPLKSARTEVSFAEKKI